uniref:Uncharacterized protein n=1 Tax=Sus scrofa TaxID=9823 RepID=A0A8D1DV73_PIG
MVKPSSDVSGSLRGQPATPGHGGMMQEDWQPPSCTSLNLQGDSSLQVEISDAVSERDKVKFTVQTKIPPAPPRPDFEASREKLQKLGEGDSSVTREEFAKMKQELERLAAHPTLRRDHNFFVFLE